MSTNEILGAIVAFAAAVAAIRYLAKTAWAAWCYLRGIFEKVEDLFDLATYELKDNGGKSIKDMVTATAERLDNVEDTVSEVKATTDALRDDFNDHISNREES